MSSEVYCGDVCGEKHQVAVEGFVLRSSLSIRVACASQREWLSGPIFLWAILSDPGIPVFTYCDRSCNRTASVDIFSFATRQEDVQPTPPGTGRTARDRTTSSDEEDKRRTPQLRGYSLFF